MITGSGIDRSDVEFMRPLLAAMCRRSDLRTQPPGVEIKRHGWRPFEVKDRTSMSRFSDAGAWECIADCLTDGCKISYKAPTLEFPDHAYVMLNSQYAFEELYIKIAIIPGIRRVVGISFHYARYR